MFNEILGKSQQEMRRSVLEEEAYKQIKNLVSLKDQGLLTFDLLNNSARELEAINEEVGGNSVITDFLLLVSRGDFKANAQNTQLSGFGLDSQDLGSEANRDK